MIFKEIPSVKESVFKLRAYGGVYDGIVGKKQIYDGCGLNNCTCAAWGLMALYLGDSNCRIGCGTRTKNQPYDAGQWYNLNNDLFEQSAIPVEGSIICYTNHVAFVNEVKPSGDIVVLESGYGSNNKAGIWKYPLYKVNNYNHGTIYGSWQGFKVPKSIEIPEVTTQEAIHKMALDVIAGKYGNGITRKNNIYKAIQAEVNKILK